MKAGNLKHALAAALAGLLTACGGGGGGSDTSSTSTPSQASTIVTTAPASSGYAPGSEQDQAFNTLNSERNTCGFGYLNHNAKLDVSAQAYVNYVVQNNATRNHIETSGLPGFTGVTPGDRMTAAGYAPWTVASESGAAYMPTTSISGAGAYLMRGLLTGPYHMMVMLNQDVDVGLTVTTGGAPGSGAQIIGAASDTPTSYLWMNLGALATSQEPASADVQTYPCQGTVGTYYQMMNEVPNPVPSRNLTTNPIGQPVLIRVRDGNTLTVTSVSVTQVSNSAQVTMLPTLTSANDPNNELTPNIAAAMPNQPLLPNTQYSVQIVGTNNGNAFTRQFTFTTGNPVY